MGKYVRDAACRIAIDKFGKQGYVNGVETLFIPKDTAGESAIINDINYRLRACFIADEAKYQEVSIRSDKWVYVGCHVRRGFTIAEYVAADLYKEVTSR